MKHKSKSAFIKILPFVLGLPVLGACESMGGPHIFGGTEVPASVMNEPRVVAPPPPSEADKVWPRLGDVPSNPRNFTSPNEINNTRRQMESDREEAEAIKRQADIQFSAVPNTLQLPAGQ